MADINLGADQISKKEELDSLKQKQKNRKRIERLAEAGYIGAKLAGNEELSEFFGESAASLREGRNSDEEGGEEGERAGAGRRFAGNVAGKQAGKLAQSKLGATGGQGAALGGAVSAAIQGEGAKGIVKTGFAWWWLNIMFGLLVLEEVTFVGILLAILSVAYLDFHYIMSKIKKGVGFFITLNWWQKPVLAFSNLVILIVPMMLMGVFAIATCSVSKDVATATTIAMPFNIGAAVTAYMGDYCSSDTGSFAGGASGGGGASGSFVLVDIPRPYISFNNFGTGVSDFPRVKQETLNIINNIFIGAKAQGLNIIVTSALRQPNTKYSYSCHMLGEATDFVLQPPVGNPRNPSPEDARRITALVTIATSAGAGYVQDEYRNPSGGATGPHVHIGLTSDPNCVGRQKEIPAIEEFYMPYTS